MFFSWRPGPAVSAETIGCWPPIPSERCTTSIPVMASAATRRNPTSWRHHPPSCAGQDGIIPSRFRPGIYTCLHSTREFRASPLRSQVPPVTISTKRPLSKTIFGPASATPCSCRGATRRIPSLIFFSSASKDTASTSPLPWQSCCAPWEFPRAWSTDFAATSSMTLPPTTWSAPRMRIPGWKRTFPATAGRPSIPPPLVRVEVLKAGGALPSTSMPWHRSGAIGSSVMTALTSTCSARPQPAGVVPCGKARVVGHAFTMRPC